MTHRRLAVFRVLAAAVVVGLLIPVVVAGQSPTAKASPKKTTTTKPWTPPLTPDGQPDLQGVWNYAAGTPLKRPSVFAGRAFLTDDELAQAEKSTHERANMDRRDGLRTADVNREFNEFWYMRRTTVLTRRTSLIVDPPDGKLPALTDDAQREQTARAAYLREHPADSWEDRRFNERCLLFLQSGPPIIPNDGPNGEVLLGFPFNFQLLQTRDYVVIRHEELRVRIIPLDSRLHVSEHILQWLGDSRGHWEGSTLVIETSNFRDGRLYAGAFTTERLRLIERITRMSPNTIDYRFTVEDPTTWTKPWTAVVPIEKSKGQLYEFACHEGNYGLPNILRGARTEEQAAEEAAKGPR